MPSLPSGAKKIGNGTYIHGADVYFEEKEGTGRYHRIVEIQTGSGPTDAIYEIEDVSGGRASLDMEGFARVTMFLARQAQEAAVMGMASTLKDELEKLLGGRVEKGRPFPTPTTSETWTLE